MRPVGGAGLAGVSVAASPRPESAACSPVWCLSDKCLSHWYGPDCVPQNSSVEASSPITPECDHIWREVFAEVIKSNGVFQVALTWCPDEKRSQGQSQAQRDDHVRSRGKGGVCRAGQWPQERPALPTPRSQPSDSRNVREKRSVG